MKINRVLALCLSPDQGGLELYVLKLLKYYHKNNQNIPVACSKNSYIAQNTKSDKIECFSSGILKNIMNFFLIRKYMIKKNLDIIHVSWSKDILLSIMLKLFTPGSIKVIFYRQMKISRHKKDIFHKFIYRHIDIIMVITDKLKCEAIKHLPIDSHKIHKLTYGIDKPPNDKSIDKSIFFKKYDMDSNIFSIGIFSRIEEQKGHHLVLNSIKKSKHEIQLFIIGHSMDDKYKDDLKKTADNYELSSKLKFINFVESPMSYMPCFDLIVLPTYEETFGLIVAEAMLMKVPVIGSNAGGVPEIIKDGNNGLLFETKNDNDLVKKIDYIIESKETKDKLINNAYEYANNKYDNTNHFDKLEKIMNSL